MPSEPGEKGVKLFSGNRLRDPTPSVRLLA
jgi:hypothetical protein